MTPGIVVLAALVAVPIVWHAWRLAVDAAVARRRALRMDQPDDAMSRPMWRDFQRAEDRAARGVTW